MQRGGSSKYGVPPSEMTPFSVEVTGHRSQLLGGISGQDNNNLPSQPTHQPQQQQMAEAVPPINSRPPQPLSTGPNFEELASTMSGNFNDDDALIAGDDTERGPPGIRWPREETLALIKIRSEMDAVFREATLKGRLWDEVSRKLADQGYARSAKKCKEKFENVHKYYKRTKEGRAGRQDGKSYRFFAQLEALNNIGSRSCNASTLSPPPPLPTDAANPQSSSLVGFNSNGINRYQPTPLSSMTPLTVTAAGGPPEVGLSSPSLPASGGRISFSTYSSSTSSSESDGEEMEEGVIGRKRKRRSSAGGGGSKKTMACVKDLMKKLMDQQEVMQQRFLETIEKREQDRMIRDEAWKRQEMARITREHEAMASKRAISASRDAAIIAFLEKITSQTIQFPQPIPVSTVSVPVLSVSPPPPPLKQQQKVEKQAAMLVTEGVVVVHDQQGNEKGIGTDPSSSRWPKMEVDALIKLRSGMESRYEDAGPKGPLWEEVSAGMKQMGYNRSAKRCKEKWENINKYFKKVKESNKKRPEDAKTCPYFHQLDALYRKKSSAIGVGGGISSSSNVPANNGSNQEHELPSPQNSNILRTDVLPISTHPPPLEHQAETDPEKMVGNGSSSNGDLPASFFGQNLGGTVTLKKPEDTVKEPNVEHRRESDVRMDDSDDNIDDDNEEEEDDEDQKMAYKIEYQMRPTNNVTSVSNGGGTNPSTAAGSFLAMVQ